TDLFHTSDGRLVVPQPIEHELLTHPLVEYARVVGQGLPQPLALLTLTEQARQLPHHEVERELEALLQRVNREMSRHEQLACMVVISDAWHRDAEATTEIGRAHVWTPVT